MERETWVDRIMARLAAKDHNGALALAKALDRTVHGIYEDISHLVMWANLPGREGEHVVAWRACPTCLWSGGWAYGWRKVQCPECGGLGKLPAEE